MLQLPLDLRLARSPALQARLEARRAQALGDRRDQPIELLLTSPARLPQAGRGRAPASTRLRFTSRVVLGDELLHQLRLASGGAAGPDDEVLQHGTADAGPIGAQVLRSARGAAQIVPADGSRRRRSSRTRQARSG